MEGMKTLRNRFQSTYVPVRDIREDLCVGVGFLCFSDDHLELNTGTRVDEFLLPYLPRRKTKAITTTRPNQPRRCLSQRIV